jgi:flavin-dependent dehydrogenase
MGWPLTTKEYGGAWIYGGKDNVVSLGFVTALDYPDPRRSRRTLLEVGRGSASEIGGGSHFADIPAG